MEKYGEPTEEQWSKIKKFLKGNKYTKKDFFVFETQAVGDRIVPNRYTRILPELLEVMKEDAQKGVSLMLNHNWSNYGVQSIPIGKVFDARIGPGTQEGETTALYVSQYILRDDSKVDGYSKNDIINLIESGIMSDTSIGWGTDTECYKCSICHNQYYSSKCDHFRGNKYAVNDNEVAECIIEVEAPKNKHAGNNVLMENSIVFDGAYPNAEIQASVNRIKTDSQFKTLSEKEELPEGQKILANSCNEHLDLYYIPFEKGGKAMEMNEKNVEVEDEKVEEVETQSNEVEEVKAEDTKVEETQAKTNEVEEVETQSNEVEENAEKVEEVKNEIEAESVKEEECISFAKSELSEIFANEEISKDTLKRLLKDGKLYRENVIQNALKSGVRSLGNSFKKDAFEKTFKLMETEDIAALGNTWETEVSEKFSSKRISEDKEIQSNSIENSSEVDYSYLKTLQY